MTSFSSSWRGALASLSGALLGAQLAAAFDAFAADDAGIFAACLGLVAPLGLACALLAWGVRMVFWQGEALPLRRIAPALSGPEGRPSHALLALPLLALGLPLSLLAASGVATRALASELPGSAGAALLPLAVLPLFLALWGGVRVAAAAAAPRLGAWPAAPWRWVLGSALALVLVMALLIGLGETGGGGGGLRILGVLRRQELDLRAPGLLLLVGCAAVLWPVPRAASRVVLACVVAFLPWVFTLQAARGSSLQGATSLQIERHAPLSRASLALLRRLSDRDGDGVSAAFAGGDCNDEDPDVSPRAIDVPGNGKDEDCLDGDAKAPQREAAAKQKPGADQQLPRDLNLLLVTIDTLRADLGYMGYPRPVSPHLDQLAKRSVVFERAYSLASYTGKSMGPLLIGKYSSELEGGFLHFNRYSKRETFVQERLQQAGVRTLSVQGYWYFFQDAGFERGFDVIDSSAAPRVAAIEGDQTSNSDEQSDAAIKLLGAPELAQSRFFMWIHYVDPHAEYAPHPEHDFGPKPRDRYDAEVAFVDQQLGRVLAALEASSFGGRTAVIVTSDHGEAFGEHGMIRHGFELWEELVRVPLIVHVPGVEPRRVQARRSGIDLVPTILELFGVQAPDAALSGRSLVPDMLSEPGEAVASRPILIDMARGPHNAERQALISGDLKLTLSEGRVLGLYDLSSDPEEKHDLSQDPQLLRPVQSQFADIRSRLRRVPMPRQ